jgi:hypothetical protein
MCVCVVEGGVFLFYNASPVPSPVHLYKDKTSRLLRRCSPKSSGTLPLTCARADRMTLRKFLCGNKGQ